MEIHMNISFPSVPCELLTLDVMDVSGEIQTGVMHGVNKVRLAPEAEGGQVIDTKALDLYDSPSLLPIMRSATLSKLTTITLTDIKTSLLRISTHRTVVDATAHLPLQTP